jgi:potassium-dependent mechanosensitive channel
LIRACVIACLVTLALARSVAAQAPATTTESPTERWAKVATAAEGQVANPEIERAQLELVRAKMAAQRTEAAAARGDAQAKLAPMTAQMDALGPAPQGDAIEAPEIATQRRTLQSEIAAAEVPLKAADAAYRRADALIGQIDGILRNRFRDELLLQQASPLDPTTWPSALAEISSMAARAASDATAGVLRSGYRIWPGLFAGIIGLILLVTVRTRVMKWFERRLTPAIGEGGATHRGVWAGGGFTVAALVIPAIGFVLLLLAARLSGMANGVAATYLADLTRLAMALVIAYWLAETLFGLEAPARDLMPIQPRKARRAARMTLILGLVVGLDATLVTGNSAAWMSLQAIVLYNFGLLCVAALALWRLAASVAPEPVQPKGGDGDAEEPADLAPLIAAGHLIRVSWVRIAKILAVMAPLLAALGFYAASRYAFYPFVLTTALHSAWMVAVAVVADGVEAHLAARSPEGAPAHSRLRLLPVLVGFVLACLALPALALIWGARASDINEAWSLLTNGISLGSTRISPLDLLTFGLIFAAGYLLTRLVQNILKSTVLPQTPLDSGGRMAVTSMIGYVGITLAAIAAISATSLDLSNLAIVAGALSVGVGFGLQNVVSNFVSGIILLIERPVKEGDWIKVGDFEGIVKRISVRATSVQTFDRAIVVIPNADLITTPVLNRTQSSTTGRLMIPVGVAYGTDTRKVEAILREIAAGCEFLLRRPPALIAFRGFGADSLNFEIIGFLRDVNTILLAANWLNHAIAERFVAEGIEIPFAQRDLHLRNVKEIGEMLRGLGAASGAAGRVSRPKKTTKKEVEP